MTSTHPPVLSPRSPFAVDVAPTPQDGSSPTITSPTAHKKHSKLKCTFISAFIVLAILAGIVVTLTQTVKPVSQSAVSSSSSSSESTAQSSGTDSTTALAEPDTEIPSTASLTGSEFGHCVYTTRWTPSYRSMAVVRIVYDAATLCDRVWIETEENPSYVPYSLLELDIARQGHATWRLYLVDQSTGICSYDINPGFHVAEFSTRSDCYFYADEIGDVDYEYSQDGGELSNFKAVLNLNVPSGGFCNVFPGNTIFLCAENLDCDQSDHTCKCQGYFDFSDITWNPVDLRCENIGLPGANCGLTHAGVYTLCSGATQCITLDGASTPTCECSSEAGKCNGYSTMTCLGCARLGDSCESPHECRTEFCAEGKCGCEANQKYYNDTDQLCYEIYDGSPCSLTGNCGAPFSHLSCNSGTCKCDSEFPIWETISHRCSSVYAPGVACGAGGFCGNETGPLSCDVDTNTCECSKPDQSCWDDVSRSCRSCLYVRCPTAGCPADKNQYCSSSDTCECVASNPCVVLSTEECITHTETNGAGALLCQSDTPASESCTNYGVCVGASYNYCVCRGEAKCMRTTKIGDCPSDGCPNGQPFYAKYECVAQLEDGSCPNSSTDSLCPAFDGEQCGGSSWDGPFECQPWYNCLENADGNSYCI